MFYLKGKNQVYYDKHLERAEGRKSKKGERVYSRAWLKGFNEVWDNDGMSDINHCKTPFEKTAYSRGKKFAKKVLDE